MTQQADETRNVLRSVWAAQSEGASTLDEDCSPTKTCKNMKGISFDGFAEPGSDLGSAWRDLLAREGKLNTSAESVRDLVLRPTEQG